MVRDFTVNNYFSLINNLINNKYIFSRIDNFLSRQLDSSILLRHDVDNRPVKSLEFAKSQINFGILGSYYFRTVPESWNEAIIKEIAGMGHEVGYHYETMDTANGDIDLAWDQFRYNLDKLRKLVDVKTICMHGSPRSKFDNRDLWNKYDYRTLSIIGEPYYEVDFNEVFYLTDTGRRWDGWKVSVRDKVPQQEEWVKNGLVFHTTNDIINAIKENRLPKKVMFTFHPQRWHNNPVLWTKELLSQSMKNVVKRLIIN